MPSDNLGRAAPELRPYGAGGRLTIASRVEADENLVRFGRDARLLYQGAGYVCRVCRGVFGVECPRCHVGTSREHPRDQLDPIRLEEPMKESFAKGTAWAIVACRRCGNRFRVGLRG